MIAFTWLVICMQIWQNNQDPKFYPISFKKSPTKENPAKKPKQTKNHTQTKQNKKTPETQLQKNNC